jgi:multidrug efflux pump subunit AcrB
VLLATTNGYASGLRWSLSHRWLIVIFCLISLVSIVFFNQILPKDFLPEEDKGTLFSLALAPEGATTEYTDKIVRRMEDEIGKLPEIGGYFSAVSLGFNGPGKGNEGLIFARFKPERSRSIPDILAGPNGITAKFLGGIEGAFAIPILPKAIGGFEQPYKLVIKDNDPGRTAKNGDLSRCANRFSGQ